ncbi:CYM1 [[Candida] subhashii]|uniref:Presequence protease, mitochondrial n=1 Tax=[Candida] subhashii TaxID=561895 RepID=A0A8J5QJ38_9ASCO|nr:CYM1 [[Candida] subhashii]KAG7662904.1 CYM1 [[Candida] subhashii]
MLRSSTTLKSCRYNQLHRFFSKAATDASVLRKYPIGLTVHGFEIKQVQPIPEYSIVAVNLKHQKSGSEHLHVDATNDNNNVFSIAFKTNPPDHTGVPHILEHTTLCGSEKYPVRDPFFKMTNRSLSNFMNAMTGHDYTYYPFATTNAKDYENLMDVYLSSVFEPQLNYNDFLQEGWRLENEDVNDIDSKITFKGVVYNEMKGQYSSSEYYFYIKYMESIYPSLNNSGGDPISITKLSYEDLLEFHSKNYHPSNSKTFTYGNLPLDKHLLTLNQYFTRFGIRKPTVDVKYPIFEKTPTQTTFETTLPGPVDLTSGKDISSQYQASVTWRVGNPLGKDMPYVNFKWAILRALLFDGHNSPFYQELIESGFAEDFSPNSGLDATTALLSFTVGLNFLTKERVQQLESKVLEILNKKVIPELENPQSNYNDRIKAIVHQVELSFKEHKPNFGFGLLNSIVPTWLNGADAVKQLQIETILNQFKQDFAKDGLKIFKHLLEETLLNPSTQRFKFTMVPNENFSKELVAEEANRLQTQVDKLSPEDKENIYKRNLDLAKAQAEEQNEDVLPTLTMDDIPPGEQFPLNHTKVNNKILHERIVDTNGLVYAYALKSLGNLPIEMHKYLPLFCSCLTNLAGTTKTSITDLETQIQMRTGGISFDYSISSNPYDISDVGLNFYASGVALKENAQHIYNLWYEILSGTKFDVDDEVVLDKLFTLITKMGSNQISNISDRGHSYAMRASCAKLTPGGYIGDVTSGIGQVEFIMEMNSKLGSLGKDYLKSEILPVLKKIQEYLLKNDGEFRYRLVGDDEIIKENEKLLESFDEKISSSGKGMKSLITNSLAKLSFGSTDQDKEGLQRLLATMNSAPIKDGKTLLNLPFQVGHASLSKRGASYDSRDGAALQVLSQLYTFKHLHSKIRESNGAYGGGLTYDGLGGILSYYSYRDPNPVKSIDTFVESFPYGCQTNWGDKDLQEAKLRIFQSLDAPIKISSQGAGEFFQGISDELRQKRRENLLNVTSKDLHEVTRKYLIDNPTNVSTVLGDNEILKVGKDWEVKTLNSNLS